MSIKVGDKAPAFVLPGTGGASYTLEQFAGAPLVLVFYPGDNTPVCTKQLNCYNDELAQFTGIGAQVVELDSGTLVIAANHGCGGRGQGTEGQIWHSHHSFRKIGERNRMQVSPQGLGRLVDPNGEQQRHHRARQAQPQDPTGGLHPQIGLAVGQLKDRAGGSNAEQTGQGQKDAGQRFHRHGISASGD